VSQPPSSSILTILSHILQASDIGVSAIVGKCLRLSSLNLASTKVTDAAIIQLCRSIPQVGNLNLNRCSQLSADALLAVADSCTLLKVLNVGSIPEAGSVLPRIAQQCRELTTLAIANSKVKDDGVQEIARSCHKLSSLYLAGATVDDTTIVSLVQRCKYLKYISLEQCEKVSDKSIQAISIHLGPTIETLMVGFTSVTDAGIQDLAKCPKLRTLDIHGAKHVTEKSLKIFRQKLPRCVVKQ
jgi:hypothetical protein